MTEEDPYDIQYDSLKRQAIIFYRGKRIVLPYQYGDEQAAREAGKRYLRENGLEI